MKEHICSFNPGFVSPLWLICEETKDASSCLTTGQAFTADRLDSVWSQKINESVCAGHITGSHQSLSEGWLVQRSSSWHSHMKAANVSCRHASHNSHAEWREHQLTAWWYLLRRHTMTTSLPPLEKMLAVSFEQFCCDLQFCVLSSLLLPSSLLYAFMLYRECSFVAVDYCFICFEV